MKIKENHTNPPEVLCQPDPGKSCGACCGLYNHRDNSRPALIERLRRITSAFRSAGGVDGDLDAYAHTMRPLVNDDKLCEDVFNCEFLGFLGGREMWVGCMIHPAENRGMDLRGRSFYGKGLCQGHLCPSHEKFSPEERLAVVTGVSDWYLYGLVVTDIDLVKGFFHQASSRLGEAPGASILLMPGVRRALAAFFRLKKDWPFRNRGAPRLGKYLFLDGGYVEPGIDYEALGRPRSRFDRILVSLESSLREAGELAEAERIVERHIEDFVSACASVRPDVK